VWFIHHFFTAYSRLFQSNGRSLFISTIVKFLVSFFFAGLRKFSLSELEAAAHHFSVENMVGSGSFATVYKGILQDGLVVAIKEFRNPYVLSAQQIDELHLVSINVKHENIAKLIGYGSSEVLERAEQFEDAKLGAKEDKETSYYFVEEYMPNGSLDKIIYGDSTRLTLPAQAKCCPFGCKTEQHPLGL